MPTTATPGNRSEILADLAAVHAAQHKVTLAEAQRAVLGSNPALARFYAAWKRNHAAQPASADEAAVRKLVLSETPTEVGRIRRVMATEGVAYAIARRMILADRRADGTTRRLNLREDLR
jgi:hypothetical protein